jgi:hypothetical protein
VLAIALGALLLSIFPPVSAQQVTAAPALVTCVNLQTGAERISRTGKCRITQEAQANWYKNQTDSPIASGANAKAIVICSNKESSPVSYQVIRKKCARHQVSTLYSRSGSLPTKPVITEAVSYGHDSASLKLAADSASTPDAPIAYYTITINRVDSSTAAKIETKRIYFWKELVLVVSGLQVRTTYTFTVSATTADGSSQLSLASLPVTTPAYVPPASTSSSSNSSSVAAPAFTLSSTAETKTVNNAISGYTITSTGGTIASFAISPAAPVGTTFNTSTGLLTGTPTASQSATAYLITATNAGGSATATFTLRVVSSAPSFTLSSTSETRVATIPLVGYTISSTGAPIASYTLEGTLPAGLNFDSSNGRITGSATETRTATTYTIIGTSASGETSTATYRLRVTGDIGDTGPGGGKIFYYLAAGFTCGPTGASTCKFLEVAPNNWSGGIDPTVSWAQSAPVNLAADTVPNRLTLNADIGLGARNTKAIIDQGNNNSTTSAAARADSYNVAIDGVNFDDWVLPSESELSQLFIRRVAVGMTFAGASYWSSSSTGGGNGRYLIVTHVSATPGSFAGELKSVAFYVRPIRAF